jgi:hypothetical protein
VSNPAITAGLVDGMKLGEYDENEDGNEGDDDFGDDFDDFEEGGEDEDFGDFGDGFQQDAPIPEGEDRRCSDFTGLQPSLPTPTPTFVSTKIANSKISIMDPMAPLLYPQSPDRQ